MKNFREILDSDSIYVFDGAVGTRFYDKGIFINRSYDELNLVQPDIVREVHKEYVKAGADIIETNTFGATRHKLKQYGLENKLHEINIAGERLAREAAGEVQTPLHGEAARDLRVGDRVWFRHAKSGELAERVDRYLLVDDGAVVGEVPTYRGEGKTFL